MNLIPAPIWTDEQMSVYFDTTLKEALSSGLTSVHDAASQPHHIAFLKRYVYLLFAISLLRATLQEGGGRHTPSKLS